METCNLEEAAAFLHMSVSSLRQKAKAGQIPGSKPGKRWVFIRADLIRYLREQAEKIEAAARHGFEVARCHSIGEAESGGFVSRHRPGKEYADRLGLMTSKQPKNSTTH